MTKERNIEDYFKFVFHNIKDKDYNLEKKICDFITRRIFDRVDVIGLDEIAAQRKQEDIAGNRTVNIYINRHLSEFDWFEMQRVLANVNMVTSVQAGDNLFIGPLDPLLRHLGGFKVFREDVNLFSSHWLSHGIYKFLDTLLKWNLLFSIYSFFCFKRPCAITIDKTLAKDIYVAYLNHLITVEGRDILMFPEYIKNSDKTIKYGRSYSGALLDFTPFLFKLIKGISKKTDINIQIVPVNLSYERVVEDQTFRTLERMKAHRFLKHFTYICDYIFNYTHWMFQGKKGRVVIKFGTPIPLKKKIDFRIRLHDEARKRVGALQTVFPSQIVAYSFHNDHEVSENDLCRRVENTITDLRVAKADLSYVDDLSPTDIIHSAYAQFNHNLTRRIMRKNSKENTYIVQRPDVVAQYSNHILHFFEKWYDKDQLIKTIKVFREKEEESF